MNIPVSLAICRDRMRAGKTFSTRCIVPRDWDSIKHFTPMEFHNPDKMGYEFILWLDALREAVNAPMILTSDYRSEEYNRLVGGAKDSAHTDIPCNVVDIGERPTELDPNWNNTRWRIINTAIQFGCDRIGLYANGSMHLDLTSDYRPKERIWRVVGNIH